MSHRYGRRVGAVGTKSPAGAGSDGTRGAHGSAPDPRAAEARLRGVDGLRALAALAVLVQHVWRFGDPRVSSPDWGVFSATIEHFRTGLTLFFVLSGFLLYRPFVAALYAGTRRPRFASYFESRALRILPAYWVILVAVALVLQSAQVRVSVSAEQYTLLDDPVQLLAAALLVQNYVPEWLQNGIGVAWSLNVEAVFYLLLPGLVLLAGALAARLRHPRLRVAALLAPAALLVAVSVTGRLAASLVDPVGPATGFDGDWHSVIARSFWVHAALFAPGMALAVVSVVAERRPSVLPRRWRGMAIAAIPVLAFGAEAVDQVYAEVNAVACALLVALVVIPRPGTAAPSRITRFFETRVLAAIGLASYSLFLWHGPVIDFLRQHDLTVSGAAGFAPNLALVLAMAGSLSALTYLCVERPALRLKSRRRARIRSAADARLAAEQEHAAP